MHTLDPANLFLKTYPTEIRVCSPEGRYLNVHNSAIHGNPKLETTHIPINIIDKLWYIYTMKCYKAMKMSKRNATNIILTKRSHSQKSTHVTIPFVKSSKISKADLCCEWLVTLEESNDWEGIEGGFWVLVICFLIWCWSHRLFSLQKLIKL